MNDLAWSGHGKQTGDRAYLKQVLDITEEAMGKLDFKDKAVADAEGIMKLLREVIQGSQRLSKKAASEAVMAYKHLWPDAIAAFPFDVITTDAILALANGLRDGNHRPDIPLVPEPLSHSKAKQQGAQIAGAIVKAYHVAVAVSGQPFPSYQLVEPVEQDLGLTLLKTTTDMRQEQVQAIQKILGNQRQEYQGIAQSSFKTVHVWSSRPTQQDSRERMRDGELDDGGLDSGTSSEPNESESNNLDPEDEARMEASEVRTGLAEDELDPVEIERQQMEDEKRVAAKRKREREMEETKNARLRLEDKERFPWGTF
ncbi:hypothetical protein NM208_g8598 [Fusarium decemcellulare]|uniref:Uncharacterized protein n=1 Tax=Fusarium decemcellulare TaxID=57161 RepID=A0ACC1S4Q8_9HYPO|nr:hypothetical protein NM208_g8598 [Fusarium decemcellulare]